MVRYDPISGQLGATAYGRAASHYYLAHDTVRIFNENLKKEMTDDEVLHVLCMSVEFEQLKMREEEMKELDGLKENYCFMKVKGFFFFFFFSLPPFLPHYFSDFSFQEEALTAPGAKSLFCSNLI